ncbi:MAG: hypothetical protein K0R26_13 [Bacteroidota bacterium]|jgi:hypothetical protein|nr:hypothetical protein [Bacteroidota bacterium]
METNLRNKGLQSIYGGLQMLLEEKANNMSALAEISILISRTDIRDRHGISDEVTQLLEAIHFQLKDLTEESVKSITDYINKLQYETGDSEIDYKTKYEQTLEKLNEANEELIAFKEVPKRKPYERTPYQRKPYERTSYQR